ncbi:MAG: hypothetical protein ABSE72_10340, partial [Bacteroidales bacterium]
SDGHVFGLRSFVDGEPNFPPVKRWIISGRTYATIALPESLGTIYFCSGQGNDSLRHIYLLYHLADQSQQHPLHVSSEHVRVKLCEVSFTVQPVQKWIFRSGMQFGIFKKLVGIHGDYFYLDNKESYCYFI